ncbi:hypothetical protein DF22_002288 [Xylella fastidiosa]|uniref:Uncharacterized protein n=1 Tax=Xylella fastidiosa subsp. sandyi Ann-1 TaxID=155920 RepID=A0A060H2X1_XYLFS|nr:hypothetical protein D934_04800 [Xylella fastidiosa subsp. sandyi Ann-1]AIC13605.1 hypothetical protein P303_03195 [Xylella fastidiosa MUL0034]ERI61041.1 hypothetical protein M233_01135 [Xylella fastidiosa subsp. multiplex Griffin-1]EWG13824.1 hypothetical protein P910_002916 [Xylella fastidiosa Mul-MD]KFA41124.1 hypothetical protein DF22_002288 [Xylella fastidiosa]
MAVIGIFACMICHGTTGVGNVGVFYSSLGAQDVDEVALCLQGDRFGMSLQ